MPASAAPRAGPPAFHTSARADQVTPSACGPAHRMSSMKCNNIDYDTCSIFGTYAERFRIKSLNKKEDLRPYCVVGIEYCRNKGDNYWQFDGLEEYPYWYHKGK